MMDDFFFALLMAIFISFLKMSSKAHMVTFGFVCMCKTKNGRAAMCVHFVKGQIGGRFCSFKIEGLKC